MIRGKRLSVSLEGQKSAFREYKHQFGDIRNLPSNKGNVYKDVSKKLS